MVRINEDRYRCSFEEVTPVAQAAHNGEEFSVVDWIVLFGWLKPTINENNFFLKVLTNVLLSIFKKLIVT